MSDAARAGTPTPGSLLPPPLRSLTNSLPLPERLVEQLRVLQVRGYEPEPSAARFAEQRLWSSSESNTIHCQLTMTLPERIIAEWQRAREAT